MIDGEFVNLGPIKPFQTLKHHNLLFVRFEKACLKIPTLMPLGGLLEACLSQFSICDGTRFRPAEASSLTFSPWVDVRTSLLKRPNQHSFASCNKERFGPACSNIFFKKTYTINYDL